MGFCVKKKKELAATCDVVNNARVKVIVMGNIFRQVSF